MFKEITAENFHNLVRQTYIQETQIVPNQTNPKGSTPRHTVVKMAKVKDEGTILKEARGKQPVTYKGNPLRLSADFSAATLPGGRGRTFKVLKGTYDLE